MFKQILLTFISLLTSLHTSLYNPNLPKLPIVNAREDQDEITLTVPKLSAKAQPQLQAQAYLIIDQKSGEILAEKNPDMRLFPASTTKIMTALVVLRDMDLEQVASVSANSLRDGSQLRLVVGEQILVKDLLAALLIQSANDAALVLAGEYPGGEEAFINRMNSLSQELKLKNTYFTNPIGYSEPGHVTTVRDLLILARVAMQNSTFTQLVSMPSKTIYSTDKTLSHPLRTTNELLGKVDGLEGIKTGWTKESGECLVAQATRGTQTLLTAVLNSPNRFAETESLLNWAFASTQNQTKILTSW